MRVDMLIADLSSDSEKTRTTAIAALQEMSLGGFIEPLGDLLLEQPSEETVALCLDLLERFDAVASMAGIRADNWFDQVRSRIRQIRELDEVIGEHFLAYTIILSIQIRSIALDAGSPWNTAVQFSIKDDVVQTLSLGELKLQVVQALLHQLKQEPALHLPLDAEAASEVLGGRVLLLAPLFGISIDRVLLGSLDETEPRYIVSYVTDEGLHFRELEDFIEEIRTHLRRDIAGVAEQPFTLDLFAVQRAREAAFSEDWDQVIVALESWPGLLSLLTRTPVAKQLDEEQRVLISEGLCLLGEALENRARSGWSEELYKLGLQFVREGKAAARLFWNLGRIVFAKGDHGVAIGLLRRALELGHPEREVLPRLGHAFLMQGKPVAAAALLERARSIGAEFPHLEADLHAVRDLITSRGVPWPVPALGVERPSA